MNKVLTTYTSPQTGLDLPPLDPARGRPRDFIEWKTLRRWDKLPPAERSVPGYLLKLVRTEAGITQKDLGRKLGISQQAVAQAERWSSNPTVSFMRTWLEACGKRLEIDFGD
jgi:DNA-binding XRE family transcriptional regulator